MRMIAHIEKSLNSFHHAAMAGIESGKAAGILLAMIALAGSAIAPACERWQRNRNVIFVDRSEVFREGEPVERQMLVVGISEDRKLTLNKFEIGTIAEINVLAEKLNAVFDDRRRGGANEREVIVEMKGPVRSEDLDKLVEVLESIDAVPIRIVRHDRQ